MGKPGMRLLGVGRAIVGVGTLAGRDSELACLLKQRGESEVGSETPDLPQPVESSEASLTSEEHLGLFHRVRHPTESPRQRAQQPCARQSNYTSMFALLGQGY